MPSVVSDCISRRRWEDWKPRITKRKECERILKLQNTLMHSI